MAELLPEGTFATQVEMAVYFGEGPQVINTDIKRGTKLGLWTERDVDRWMALGNTSGEVGKPRRSHRTPRRRGSTAEHPELPKRRMRLDGASWRGSCLA
jgi:hypothetical protein